MGNIYETLRVLGGDSKTWLVTGSAGFIGSHLVETLLRQDQRVVGLDNLTTGKAENLDEVLSLCTPSQRANFRFIQGDIRSLTTCAEACRGVDYVLHQAALGSVPGSIENPVSYNETNVGGFVNILWAARSQKVKRVVYASSSAVYGDDPEMPKREEQTGHPVSPYAATKAINELYANAFSQIYGIQVVGLRYFNVFGPRQDPRGAYAAVIPQWIAQMIGGQQPAINGDGSGTRDFCFVANVVQANLLAALTKNPGAIGEVFNVALNQRTTLLELFDVIRCALLPDFPHLATLRPLHREPRSGDIQHSWADIERARALLGYSPTHTLEAGMKETLAWYQRANAGGGACETRKAPAMKCKQ